MNDSNTWETRRQRLIRLLTVQKFEIDLKLIMKEMEYSHKRVLINDIISISKTLKNEGKYLVINPPSCAACGYIFQSKLTSLKIPSKCPKCREQRIYWPTIRMKDK